MRTIKVIHISDLHVRRETVQEFKLRVKAFLDDVSKLCSTPDFLVVSGDIAFSGLAEQYSLAEDILFKPFMARFKLDPERIIIAIGNHDINRDNVESVVRDGVIAQLRGATRALEKVPHAMFDKIWNPYIEFAGKYSLTASCGFGEKVVSIDGIKVGFVVYNSALVCFDKDVAVGDLYLTKEQVDLLSDSFATCAVRLGVMHHPVNWLNPIEKDVVVSDLKNKSPILLTGHMHDEESLSISSPDGRNLEFTTTSFFAGEDYAKDHKDGYNIYEFDPERYKVKASYRSFKRKTCVYIWNLEHSDEGVWETTLDRSAFGGQINLPMVRDVLSVADRMDANVVEALKSVQKIEGPVYVEPLISRVNYDSKRQRVYTPIAAKTCLEYSKINIMYAPNDVGSTMYLQKLCSASNRNASANLFMFYLTMADLKNVTDINSLQALLSSKYAVKRLNMDMASAGIVIDEVQSCSPQKLKNILESINGVGKVFVCVKTEFLFDSLMRGNVDEGTSFYEFRYWGASKIREFVSAYGKAAGVDIKDIDEVLTFVLKSFSASDIQITPQLVAFYLRMFKDGAVSLDGVSLVELLQQLEGVAIASCKGIQRGDRYYCQEILKMLSRCCFELKCPMVSKADICDEFDKMIAKAGLEGLKADTVIEALCNVGMITMTQDGMLMFTSYVFLRYYLAQVVADDDKLFEQALGTVDDAILLGKAASYFVAKNRNARDVVDRLLKIMHARHPGLSEVTAQQFEEYANDVLFSTKKENADDVAKKLLEKKPEDTMSDKDFDDRRAAEHDDEKRHFNMQGGKSDYDEVDKDLAVLRMVYNVFRNLETIPEEDKCKLLDEILNFCLHVGLRLVKVFVEFVKEYRKVSSFFAYVSFLFDVEFISENISSKKLAPILEKVYAQTTNELKRFFLIMIMKECGVKKVEEKLLSLISNTTHGSIIEMGYFEVTEWLIAAKQERVPENLVKVFKQIFTIKNGKMKYGDEYLFNLELADIRNKHLALMQRKVTVAGQDFDR